MDFQSMMNFILPTACAVLGWFCRELWTATTGVIAGSGGGSGGAAGAVNIAGGFYGAGAGGVQLPQTAVGGSGIIVFTYYVIAPSNGNYFLMF